MEDQKYTNKIFYLLLFFAIIVSVFLLKLLSSVFIPIALAAMLSFILLPIIKKLNLKTGIPWVISSVVVVVLFCIVLLGITSLLLSSLTMIISEYPKYESKFMAIYQVIAKSFNLEIDETKSFIENMWKFLKVREYVQKVAVFLSSGIFAFGKNLFLIALMSTFLLIEMRITKRKMHYAFSNEKDKVTRIGHQIANETMRYISIKFVVSLATGFICYLVTKISRMDFPVIWAFLSFIMNFIPIFGSIISVGLTTLFAIVQFNSNWVVPLIIFILMTITNVTIGNIIEPRIEGKHLGISPFIILVSLSMWGFIWGFTGMLIAVPLTVIIKIVCENIEYLNFFAIILGNNPKKDRENIDKD